MTKPLRFGRFLQRSHPPLLTTMLFFFMLSGLIITNSASAHFHYNVDVKTALQYDDRNRLKALKQTWLYDAKVSAIMLEDNTDLIEFGEAMLKDLKQLGYFTQLSVNGKPVKTTIQAGYTLKKSGNNSQPRLQLDFILGLANPLRLTGKQLFQLDHTDPSGSAMLRYRAEQDLNLGSLLSRHCKTIIRNRQSAGHGEAVQSVSWQCEHRA